MEKNVYIQEEKFWFITALKIYFTRPCINCKKPNLIFQETKFLIKKSKLKFFFLKRIKIESII